MERTHTNGEITTPRGYFANVARDLIVLAAIPLVWAGNPASAAK